MRIPSLLKRKRSLNRQISNPKSKLFKASVLLIVLILVFVISWVVKLGIFKIKNVEVEAKNITCATSEQILNASEVTGQNYLLLNTEEITQNMKKKFICIKDVSFNIDYLKKVVIKVSNRMPFAVLSILDEKKDTPISSDSATPNTTEATPSANLSFNNIQTKSSFLIDDEGVIFQEKQTDLNLPNFYVNQDLRLGQSLDKNLVQKLIQILGKLKEFGLVLNQGKIYLPTELILNGEPKLVFDLNLNIGIQLASLQLILQEAKINEENIEFIDLRFDKPVVKYLPKKGK